MTSHFEIYQDKSDKYRWRLTADNGRIIGASSQGYIYRHDCVQNSKMVADQLTKAVANGEAQYR